MSDRLYQYLRTSSKIFQRVMRLLESLFAYRANNMRMRTNRVFAYGRKKGRKRSEFRDNSESTILISRRLNFAYVHSSYYYYYYYINL